MNLKIKRLSENAVLPSRAHESDAGLDLTATSKEWTRLGDLQCVYGTGLSVAIPEGHVGLLFPRSSIFKQTLSLTNSVGVIDSGYRGEIMFRFRELNDGCDKPQYSYEVGDRIGQLVILELPKFEIQEVDDLDETDRGTGGFGSSGQ